MPIFRSGPSPFQTALAMVAAKPGHDVLVLGAGDPGLAAEIGVVTGLNGRTAVVVADADAARRAEAAAGAAGSLLEIAVPPAAALTGTHESYDVVVLNQTRDAAAAARTPAALAHDLLRPGGRVVVIEGDARAARGWAPWRRPAATPPASDVQAALDAAGFRATRVLAEVAGAVYVEGVKPRP